MKAKREMASVARGTLLDDIVEVLRRGRGDPRRCKPALARLIESVAADAGSLFLFDDDGVSLRGAHGIWDWTRTSFRVRIDLWPSVEKAVDADRAVGIMATGAKGLEADWFEPGGVASCICAPMVVGGRRVGVLFVDYFQRRKRPAPAEIELAAEVAASWGEILVAERQAALHSGIRELRAFAEPRTVAKLMTLAPLIVDERVSVQVAHRLASARDAGHVLVVRGGVLSAAVRRSVLEEARPSATLGELPARALHPIGLDTTPREAARAMLDTGACCLPVLDGAGEIVGVLTREHLLGAGLLPGERGIDVCAACGESHDLGDRAEDALVFCGNCLGSPANDGVEALYETLGGSG